MTHKDTYDRFDRATANIEAYALLRDGQFVGRALIKIASAKTMYLQAWGTAMQTGRAGGGGYDRSSAAFDAAARKMIESKEVAADLADRKDESARATVNQISIALHSPHSGRDWKDRLADAGIVVAQIC